MGSPQRLLDALDDSITSGTFIDTKFYVFSRREASGRVGSPRPLYCNSRVLGEVPYFSTLFSDGFSEGRLKDIDESFPPDSRPYTEDYDYLSDSDLEDEEPEQEQDPRDAESQVPPTSVLQGPLGSSQCGCKVGNDPQCDSCSVRMGRIAIISDMAAITFEAMIHFLYTGEITFAPFSSDPFHPLPAEARTGDWVTGRPPSPSAKSIYRLADKYDIPTLKERAKAHIAKNLMYCNIVDEVFSGFSLSFPEILSMQVPRLVKKMREESREGSGSDTMEQLLNKIAALSQSQLSRATDVLATIWDTAVKPLDLPAPETKSTPSAEVDTPPPNWHRVQLALLRSIPTGIFLDVKLYAYNAIYDNLPVDPKPLFTSSIVVEEWGPAIVTQTLGGDSGAASIMDGVTDDYEDWRHVLPDALDKEAEIRGSHEVVMLMSGARKTWISLLSYAYTNEMTFASLRGTIDGGERLAPANAQSRQSCSPRSMYSLATMLGIDVIKEDALRSIQSRLSTSNIVQELFTVFSVNHRAVMDMEIEFFGRNLTEENPELLMEHIQKMASGDAPFFSTTLSLVYRKLFEKVLPLPIAPARGPRKSPIPKDKNVTKPSLTTRAPSSISNARAPTSTTLFSNRKTASPVPSEVISNTTGGTELLKCSQCGQPAKVVELQNGLHCPRCPSGRGSMGRPYMRCLLCNGVRTIRRGNCLNIVCRARFT